MYYSNIGPHVRGLGGKLGESVVSQLGVETMADLAQLSLANIGAKFEARTAHWLHLLAQGKDGEVETYKWRRRGSRPGCIRPPRDLAVWSRPGPFPVC